MEKMQEKIEGEVSKIKDKIEKSKNKVDLVKEKNSINKIINENQELKSRLFLDMGILTYDKIRKNEIVDTDFDEISNEIVKIDKIIYENMKIIEALNKSMEESICECGKTISKGAKFCAECGKKVEIELEEKEYITCEICNMNIDIDSIYCICCGNKIN